MREASIRLKLTVWYFAALTAAIGIFGVAAFFAVERGIQTTVDEGLRNQARGIEELMDRVLREDPEDREDLTHELKEHSEIRTTADFSQVYDQQGRWVYRTPLMIRYDVPQPSSNQPAPYDLAAANGFPLRVFVSSVAFGDQKFAVQVAAPMQGFYAVLARFKWLTLLLSPFLIILASAGGYWLSRRALAPVDDIIRAAQNINSKNLSKRLQVLPSNDELQRLTETLNGMLGRLEAAFNRITQFTADASHELRTPLALMRTTTEVSLRTSANVAEYRAAQTTTLEELEKMSALVEKLMLLTRADAGVETLHRQHLDLAAIVRDACKQGRVLADAKMICFEEDLSPYPLMVDGDQDGLFRLFLILMDNAVKYTAANGRIRVSLWNGNRSAHVEVRDNGIGISSEDLPYIFERFYRADKARSRESGGVGLGLSIARWEAEAHGGTIKVESSLGAGSVFRVELPLIAS